MGTSNTRTYTEDEALDAFAVAREEMLAVVGGNAELRHELTVAWQRAIVKWGRKHRSSEMPPMPYLGDVLRQEV